MSKFSQRRNFGLQKKNKTELPSIHQSAFQLLFSPDCKKNVSSKGMGQQSCWQF